MLTLCTLLPRDNERLLGRFKGFADLLLSASDNIPVFLGGEYRAHIKICPPIVKSTHSNSDNYTIMIII